MRTLGCAILLLAWLPSGSTAQTPLHPSSLDVNGAPLEKIGEAVRSFLLGQEEAYGVALYVDGSSVDVARLASADTPKALRLVVRQKDEIRPRIALDWKRELLPRVEPGVATHLQGTFAPLRHGDVVLIEYAPRKGTTVRVNSAVAVSGADHDLMLAFLDHWLGQNPVSEDLKQHLLAGRSTG